MEVELPLLPPQAGEGPLMQYGGNNKDYWQMYPKKGGMITVSKSCMPNLALLKCWDNKEQTILALGTDEVDTLVEALRMTRMQVEGTTEQGGFVKDFLDKR